MKIIFSFLSQILFLAILQGIGGTDSKALLPEPKETATNNVYHGEIHYKLEKNDYFEEQISYFQQAPSFRIGTRWKESVGTRSDLTDCTKLTDDQFDLDKFRTKIAIGSKDDFTEIKNDAFYDHFVFIEREVWSCRNTEAKPSYHFYRIVNVIQGTSEIYKLYYFDGITFSRFNLPAMQSSKHIILRNTLTAVITEVKYLRVDDYKELKYEGTFKFYDPSSYDNVLSSMFEPVYLDRPKQEGVQFPYEKEVSYFLEKGKGHFRLSRIGPNGDIIRIGKAWTDELGLDSDVADCNMNLNDDRVYSSRFLPECLIREDDYKDFPVRDKDNEFKDYDCPILVEYFTVTRHEVWTCQIKRSSEKFIRTVTELVGRKPIKKLEYYDGISVWQYRLDANSNSVKIRSIHYSKENQLISDVYVNYSGSLNLIEIEDKNKRIEELN